MKNRSLFAIFIFASLFCFVLFIGCKSKRVEMPHSFSYAEISLNELNNKIDRSQKKALDDSPFRSSAKHVKFRIKIQKANRKWYINELRDILTKNPLDTIFLTEAYSGECINCPANNVRIYKDSILIHYRSIYENELIYKRCQRVNHFDSPLYIQYGDDSTSVMIVGHDEINECDPWNLGDDILELKRNIAIGDNLWNANPEIYGTEEILGGGYTLYTVLFPDGRVESMYIRAWHFTWPEKKINE